MKPRHLLATLAASAAFAGHPLPARPLSFQAALDIAQREIVRRGLATTYHVSAFYAGVDRRAESAAFAAIVRPLAAADAGGKRRAAPPRLKLLIHDDGRTTLQPVAARLRAQA